MQAQTAILIPDGFGHLICAVTCAQHHILQVRIRNLVQ
jgi:hypothetical protein